LQFIFAASHRPLKLKIGDPSMKKKTQKIGYVIITSAIIWGAIIYGCAHALKGTGCYSDMQNILFGGVFAHLILVWIPMGIICKGTAKIEGTHKK